MPVAQVPMTWSLLNTTDEAGRRVGLKRAPYIRQALLERLARDGFVIPVASPVDAEPVTAQEQKVGSNEAN
jgi:hypothetical protein